MSCSAVNCRSRPSDKVPGVTFHRFPKNDELKKKWVAAMKRVTPHNKSKAWIPSESSRICSKHFHPEDFDRTPFKVLIKENAIPSLFEHNEKQQVKFRREIVKHDLPPPPPPMLSNRKSILKKAVREQNSEILVLKERNCEIEKLHEITTAEFEKLRQEKNSEVDNLQQMLQERNLEIEKELKEENSKLKNSLRKKNLIIRNLKIKLRKQNSTCLKNLQLKKKLKRLQNAYGYSSKKIHTMKEAIEELHQKELIQKDDAKLLAALAENETFLAIVKRHAKKTENPNIRDQYDEKLRAFAITLSFLGEKAYEFVRNVMQSVMPCVCILLKILSKAPQKDNGTTS